MAKHQHYRDQVADLILKDDNGEQLIVTSDLTNNEDGSMTFEVGQPQHDGDRYKVTIKIEEI